MILICLHVFAFHVEAVPKLLSHSLNQMGSISGVPSSALKLVKVAPVSQDFWNFAPAAKVTQGLPSTPVPCPDCLTYFLNSWHLNSASQPSYVLTPWVLQDFLSAFAHVHASCRANVHWRTAHRKDFCAACTHAPDFWPSHSCERKCQSTCTRAGETCDLCLSNNVTWLPHKVFKV